MSSVEKLLRELYNYISELSDHSIEKEVAEQVKETHDKLLQLVGVEETDRIWWAAASMGIATAEDAFLSGLRMGMELTTWARMKPI